MNHNIIRPIDDFGRIVLPKELRERLGVDRKSSFEITVQDGCLVLQPVYMPLKSLDSVTL